MTDTESRLSYWGITNNLERRALEHARVGRFGLKPLPEFVSRLAARGAARTGINESGGVGNVDNAINSIAPSSGVYEEAAAQAEQENPGALQQIANLAAQILSEIP